MPFEEAIKIIRNYSRSMCKGCTVSVPKCSSPSFCDVFAAGKWLERYGMQQIDFVEELNAKSGTGNTRIG